MRLSVHLHDENKSILVLDEGPTRGLDDTALAAEAKYPINLHIQEKKILHCNRTNSFLYFNAVEVYQFKAKDFEMKPYPLCLGNIWKIFTIAYKKKNATVLN